MRKPLFLRESQIVSERGKQGLLPFSRSTLLRRVAEGEFPKPVNLGGGVRAYRVADIEQWLARFDVSIDSHLNVGV